MTDQRTAEIRGTGQDIVEIAADIQLVLQAGDVTPEQIDELGKRLQFLREKAASLMRVNGHRLDVRERARLSCQNSLNGLRQQLDTINTRSHLDDLAMHRLMISLRSTLVKGENYLTITMQTEEASHAG